MQKRLRYRPKRPKNTNHYKIASIYTQIGELQLLREYEMKLTRLQTTKQIKQKLKRIN